MNAKFFDLSKDKQDRMINAALKLFAQNGYRHASTDDIVREAGISKGLLFHYFGSKIGVYSFVYDYSVRYMTLEFKTTINPNERDIFEVLKQKQQAFLHAMRRYPYMQQFLNRSNSENVNEALIATEEKRGLLNAAYEGILEKTDREKIPTGIDIDKLYKTLDLTIKGIITEHFQNGSFQPDMVYEEIVDFLNMMKKIVYR